MSAAKCGSVSTKRPAPPRISLRSSGLLVDLSRPPQSSDRRELLHVRDQTSLGELRDEHLVHARVLVAVFDLVAARLHVLVDLGVNPPHILGERMADAALGEGEVAPRLGA